MKEQDKEKVVVQIINESDCYLKDIMVYSASFENIEPNKSSPFKGIEVSSDERNPMLYLSCKNINMGSYVSLPKDVDTIYFLINEVKIDKRLIVFKQIEIK